MAGTTTLRRPPGPGSVTLWVDLLRHRDPLGSLGRLAAAHPRVAHLRLGREHVYLLTHPELVTALLTRAAKATRKGRLQEKIRIVLGDGLLTSEGEDHARQRRLIQPALHRDRIDAYLPLMRTAADQVSQRWRDGARVDLAREMSALTLTVVGRSLFGRGLERETAEIAACLDVLLGGFARHLVPGADRLLSVPTPKNRRMLAAADRLDTVVRTLVADPAPGSLLTTLAQELTPQQARDHAMTLLLAGHETTAIALTWAWWLLDRHPEVARWWHEEIDHAGTATPEQLPRSQAVLAESLRLYPPAWLLGRRPLRPIELDDWTVPAGTLCLVSQWTLQRDPRFWDDPLEFRPERWLRDGGYDETAPGQPRGAYLPFGIGARACVGRGFAWLEGTVVLAGIGRHWAPRPVPVRPVTPLPAFTLRPRGGMPAVLRRRPA